MRTRPTARTGRAAPPAPSAEFLAAYDAVLAHWPAGTERSAVPTPFGETRVNSCGPHDAPPVLLLPGGGSTSTVWFTIAAELGRTHRVHAVDIVGDAGRSVPNANPLRTVEDLAGWLDAVLDGLGLDSAALCGHSYGGWIALQYALNPNRRRRRVDKLVLLDPTLCFAGFSPRYLLHALPMLLRPTPRRTRAFVAWETYGAPLDPGWLRLHAMDFPAAGPARGPRPDRTALRELTVPTLLMLAERSRAHDVDRVAATARESLPDVRTVLLPGATHHSLPLAAPAGTGGAIADFLAE
ncbi:alpha/beta fold hydrolase [Streptomyces niveus]|uniref:alpha/beta fold hydrolase n=1 Tax=Streptomyces niveus TaxID=193462 RepID=UPI003632BF1F